MNILKKVGLGILSVIAILLFVAIFVSKDMNYEKSITINAPIEKVWVYTHSLEGLDQWSPWNDHDPNMKKELTGTDGQVGATQSWSSPVEQVGSGSQTIANIAEPNLFETDLKFTEPFESAAKAYVSLTTEGNATVVTWGFKSRMPYPMNLMGLFMNMEESMGKDWDNGLGKLKTLAETAATPTAETAEEISLTDVKN